VIKLDPKLDRTTALFEGRSGIFPVLEITFFVPSPLFVFFRRFSTVLFCRILRASAGDASSVFHFRKEFALRLVRFSKPKISVLLLFLLLDRSRGNKRVKMVTPFLLAAREVAGLGLTRAGGFVYTAQVGAIIALTVGGWAGGFVASRTIEFLPVGRWS